MLIFPGWYPPHCQSCGQKVWKSSSCLKKNQTSDFQRQVCSYSLLWFIQKPHQSCWGMYIQVLFPCNSLENIIAATSKTNVVCWKQLSSAAEDLSGAAASWMIGAAMVGCRQWPLFSATFTLGVGVLPTTGGHHHDRASYWKTSDKYARSLLSMALWHATTTTSTTANTIVSAA